MKRFRNILCVITGDRDAGQVLERAVRLAESNHARLRIIALVDRVSVGMGMPDGGPVSVQLQAALIRNTVEFLDGAIAAFHGRVDTRTQVLVGTSFLEVIHEVLRHGHDLVIRAAEDPEWLSRLFGSDDMHLLRKCPCPVWLLKPRASKRFRSILAAVDLDDSYAPADWARRQALNEQVLQLAASLAVADLSALHVCHAWEAIGESVLRGGFMNTPEAQVDRYLEQVRRRRKKNMDRLLKRLPAERVQDAVELRTHLVKGSPRAAIPALARSVDADLVVMGTVARTGIPGLIVGNTAEMILSQIDCSVLAIKPPGFVSPVTLPARNPAGSAADVRCGIERADVPRDDR